MTRWKHSYESIISWPSPNCRPSRVVRNVVNMLVKKEFEMCCQELDFSKYCKTFEKIGKAHKVRSIISHFNGSFSACASNNSTCSIDKHMVKFKRRSNMRQYVKNKPIKWGHYFSYHCPSKTVKHNNYTSSTYNWARKKAEKRTLESVNLGLSDTYCTIFFENLFNIPSLIIKLFDKSLYRICTARMGRKGMLKMKPGKQMKRGYHEY